MLDFIIITGPTAVGKTALAERLALRLNAEIITADSQTVYRELNIGTAKPFLNGPVTHHLINIRDVHERYDVSEFIADATKTIDQIRARGKKIIISGGTPMYLQKLTQGLCEAPGQFRDIRSELTCRWNNGEQEVLRNELVSVDPQSAERIHPNDAQRTIRALEVWYGTKKTLTEWHATTVVSPYSYLYFILNRSRENLYERINNRVDAMIAEGWIEEVKNLLKKYTGHEKAFESLGYRTIIKHLHGEISYDDMLHTIKRDTRHFARRQLIWFRKVEEAIWYDCEENNDDLIEKLTYAQCNERGGLR